MMEPPLFPKLKRTGVYNCDQISRMVNPASIRALARTIAGKIISAVMAYVISKKKNMALTFYASSYDAIGLSFSTTDSFKILLIHNAERVTVIPARAIKAEKNYLSAAEYAFTASDYTDKALALPEIRKMLSWR